MSSEVYCGDVCGEQHQVAVEGFVRVRIRVACVSQREWLSSSEDQLWGRLGARTSSSVATPPGVTCTQLSVEVVHVPHRAVEVSSVDT